MDPDPKPIQLPGRAAPNPRVFLALIAGMGALSLFEMRYALIRPVALGLGKPATAVVGAKLLSYGRRGSVEYWLRLDYPYSSGSAASPELKVNARAYSAIAEKAAVPIHFVPGCRSCVALDQDYDSARQQVFSGLFAFFAVTLIVGLQLYLRSARRTAPPSAPSLK